VHRIVFVIIPLCLLSAFVHAQDTFSIMVGGVIGYQHIEASKWSRVYKSPALSYGGLFGVGNGETFVFGKYRVIKTTGTSVLENITVNGKADWDERFIVAGLHTYVQNTPFEAGVGYVWLHATEKIWTENPAIPELSNSQTLTDHGVNVLIGLSFGHDVRLNFDLEYIYLFDRSTTSDGHSGPNLGGLYYGTGISIIL